jgi:hypothetical protein
MTSKKKSIKSDLSRPITMGDLGTFTEDVILPGIERIVEEKLDELQTDMKSGFAELKESMKDVHNSIKVLAGEIVELKVGQEDQRHEERIGRLERRLGIARR